MDSSKNSSLKKIYIQDHMDRSSNYLREESELQALLNFDDSKPKKPRLCSNIDKFYLKAKMFPTSLSCSHKSSIMRHINIKKMDSKEQENDALARNLSLNKVISRANSKLLNKLILHPHKNKTTKSHLVINRSNPSTHKQSKSIQRIVSPSVFEQSDIIYKAIKQKIFNKLNCCKIIRKKSEQQIILPLLHSRKSPYRLINIL